MTEDENQQHPSLLRGHVEYVKGVIEVVIGKITGSQAWTTSGQQAKTRATWDLRAAIQARDANTQGYGKVGELAGKAVGCQGMVKEGGEWKEYV